MRPEELDVFLRNGIEAERIPKHRGMRASMFRYLKKHETPPPKWMVASGMYPEVALDLAERRKRVRIIHTTAVLIIRRELKRHEVDAFKAERSIFWDPVAEVCQAMEISQSKLSRFCKELTGNSLSQVIDSVRAEGLKRKLRAQIKGFLVSGFRGFKVSGESKAQCACLGTKWEVWEALKASRKWPEFSQNTWAQEVGFASYRRLYRACQVIYGMTPHQLELALIEERVSEFQVSGFQVGRGTGLEFAEVTLEEAERMVREIRVDEWVSGGGTAKNGEEI